MFHPTAPIKAAALLFILWAYISCLHRLVNILVCSLQEGIAWSARGISSGGHLFFYPRKKTFDVRERALGKYFSRDIGQKAVWEASVNWAHRELLLVFTPTPQHDHPQILGETFGRCIINHCFSSCLNFNFKAFWICKSLTIFLVLKFAISVCHRFQSLTNLLPRLDRDEFLEAFLAFILCEIHLLAFFKGLLGPCVDFPCHVFCESTLDSLNSFDWTDRFWRVCC